MEVTKVRAAEDPADSEKAGHLSKLPKVLLFLNIARPNRTAAMSSQKFKDSQKGKIRDLRRNLPDIKAQGIERPSKKRKVWDCPWKYAIRLLNSRVQQTTADRRDDAIATATVENDSHDQQDSPAQAPPSKKLKTSEAVSENEVGRSLMAARLCLLSNILQSIDYCYRYRRHRCC